MTPKQKIARLEELERKERHGQRKAARIAWSSVVLAAVTLALLILASYVQLSSIRGNIAELKREQAQLAAENKKLTAENEEKKKLLWEIEVPSGGDRLEAPGPPLAAAAPRPSPALASIPPRIYMHITEQSDRDFADRVGRALSAQDFLVIGTEYLPLGGKLRRTEVRYYKRADSAKADQIAAVLRANGATGAETAYLKRYENSTAVRPNVFEVWFPPNVGEGRPSAR